MIQDCDGPKTLECKQIEEFPLNRQWNHKHRGFRPLSSSLRPLSSSSRPSCLCPPRRLCTLWAPLRVSAACPRSRTSLWREEEKQGSYERPETRGRSWTRPSTVFWSFPAAGAILKLLQSGEQLLNTGSTHWWTESPTRRGSPAAWRSGPTGRRVRLSGRLSPGRT